MPLPLPTNLQTDTAQTIPIAFSSHKKPISGYLRVNLQSNEQFYPPDMLRNLFPVPQQHTTIPKSLLRNWYERNLWNATANATPPSLLGDKTAHSDTDDDGEGQAEESSETCTFQEDLLRFCNPLELENNKRLKLLHSRYLKNDARTRDLKFIPMLEHEIEFEWETEESVLDPGNWMDPIDLHKHEGKKYLSNLYTAIQNHCERLTKMAESRENLLLNDEPISWRYSTLE